MEVRYQVISSASLCSKQGLFWGQARWLRGLSSRVFKTEEDRERNLLRPTTWWKKALLYTRLLFQLHYLLVSQKAWVHLLINLHVGTGMLLLAAPKATFSPSETSPSPTVSHLGKSAQALALIGAICWAHPFVYAFMLLGSPKTKSELNKGMWSQSAVCDPIAEEAAPLLPGA